MPQINFTEEDWQRIRSDNEAWWNHELDRPLVYLAVTKPETEKQAWSYQSNYPVDMPVEDVIDCYAPQLEGTRFYADGFPWWWPNFGPGIAAGFLGAQMNSVTDPGETVWFTPPAGLDGAPPRLEYDAGNVWWQRVQDLTRAMVERYNGLVQVAHTDLGGNMDVLASFRTTQQLLFDVVEQPEQIMREVEQITQLWLRYYNELDAIIRASRPGVSCPGTSAWAPIWSPGKTYMLQCDFSYMISPKMFERFVVPDLTACCAALDHGFYHLDGKGEIPHLKHLLGIERLRGIQWIPGDGQPSPDQWLELLKRIRDGGKLCQVFVTPEGARRIVQNLGGRGFLFVIQNYGPEFQNPDEVQGFLRALKDDEPR